MKSLPCLFLIVKNSLKRFCIFKATIFPPNIDIHTENIAHEYFIAKVEWKDKQVEYFVWKWNRCYNWPWWASLFESNCLADNHQNHQTKCLIYPFEIIRKLPRIQGLAKPTFWIKEKIKNLNLISKTFFFLLRYLSIQKWNVRN